MNKNYAPCIIIYFANKPAPAIPFSGSIFYLYLLRIGTGTTLGTT